MTAYNKIAYLALGCGTILGAAAIVQGTATTDVIALVAPFVTLAGVVVGRGNSS